MNYSIDHRHRDADLFGLLYGFSFRPGERGREIESAEALQRLTQFGQATGAIAIVVGQ